MHIPPPHILSLIEKYLSGTLNAGERQLLNEWYQSFSDDGTKIFSNNAEEDATAERLAVRIKESIELYEKSIRNRNAVRRRRLYMVAATIVTLLISFGVYRYFFRNGPPNPTIARHHQNEKHLEAEIKPGGNKALLTLSDGSTIVLDSASNGMLSRQGNIKVLKLDNGLLSYTRPEAKNTGNNEPVLNTISTPRGGQYQVILSDGTKVWLNAASSISFPVAFTGTLRNVSVTGEVYFEVARNKFKPFKVQLNNSEIEVLGTHFNVNAYEDEATVKTTLLEGKIKQTTKNNAFQKILLPGQQSSIGKNGEMNVSTNVDTEEAVAWMHGNFQFKSAGLGTVLRQVSRWYDVDIEYEGNVNLHFTGQLPRSQNVYTLFKNLALTGEVHFRIEGRKVIVSP